MVSACLQRGKRRERLAYLKSMPAVDLAEQVRFLRDAGTEGIGTVLATLRFMEGLTRNRNPLILHWHRVHSSAVRATGS